MSPADNCNVNTLDKKNFFVILRLNKASPVNGQPENSWHHLDSKKEEKRIIAVRLSGQGGYFLLSM